MGIDHRRTHVRMTEQLLNGPDSVPVFEQIGCEGLTKRVTGSRFGHPRPADGFLGGALQDRFMKVVPAPRSRSWKCWVRTKSKCRAGSALAAGGGRATRALSPLRPRTAIWLEAKSTSFTLSRAHSRSRMPPPHGGVAISRAGAVQITRAPPRLRASYDDSRGGVKVVASWDPQGPPAAWGD